MLSRISIGLGLALTATASTAEFPVDLSTVTGRAIVHEAALLEINGLRIRLDGIDALGPNERCAGEPEWRCGEYARDLMAGFVRDYPVRCRLSVRSGDTWNASCSMDRIDLQAFLVSRGLARPVGRAGGLYADLAKRAIEQGGPIYARAAVTLPAGDSQ